MSATGRGAKRKSHDFYPTPRYCVDRLLDRCTLKPGLWLEPGAGNGAIIRAVNARVDGVRWVAIEKRASCLKKLEATGAQVLIRSIERVNNWPTERQSLRGGYDVAIGNPPYRQAQEFVEICRVVARHTFLLLRINFLGSERRQSWISQDVPDIYVVPNRPSFSGKGTDATEYAWFHWGEERRTAGCVEILDSTPALERKLK